MFSNCRINSKTRSTDCSSPILPDGSNVNQSVYPKVQENNDLKFGLLNTQNTHESNSTSNNISHSSNLPSREYPESQRNGKEIHKIIHNSPEAPRLKLFEELHECVYREVASLISALESRPHFLIQLFRDLQLIGSDPLRRLTLQSIQCLITNSLVGNAQGAVQQNCKNSISTPENKKDVEFGLRTQPVKCFSAVDQENILLKDDFSCDDIVMFLNVHDEDDLQSDLMGSLREILIMSESFQKLVSNNLKNETSLEKLTSLLTEKLDHFKGKKVAEIIIHLLQTIVDLFKSEMFVTHLEKSMQEKSEPSEATNHVNPPQIQNGDLAEAGQSQTQMEDEEEEGAVGGLLNILSEHNNSTSIDQCETKFTEQGLDQVPTRLTYSRSVTPDKDCFHNQ